MAWLMTPFGYTSSVRHRTQKDSLMVRARDERSLHYFCDSAGIDRDRTYTDFPSDYPFRVVATQAEHDEAYLAASREIDYTNFKTRAAQVRPSTYTEKVSSVKGKKGKKKKRTVSTGDNYVDFLHRLWSLSHMLTPAATQKKNDEARWKWSTYNPSSYTLKDLVGGDEPAVKWPFASELLDLSEEEREEVIDALLEAKDAGDEDAADVLTDWAELDVDISSMTDEQFAMFEAGDKSI